MGGPSEEPCPTEEKSKYSPGSERRGFLSREKSAADSTPSCAGFKERGSDLTRNWSWGGRNRDWGHYPTRSLSASQSSGKELVKGKEVESVRKNGLGKKPIH